MAIDQSERFRLGILADKAKTHYANYDFLDSYRLALAASQ